MLRGAALGLTALTGFSGLVYQVVWQKLLASLLGSHSEATAAVLGLFLGGLSLGYALFGSLARRLERRAAPGRPAGLLLAYGIVEAAIGVIALLFPWLFAGVRALSLALPALPGSAAFGLDVALAALLVLPPTVLMGGTIPLLTQGLSKSVADATRLHSNVYAFNTAGAFLGALAAGFVIVPVLGLERAVWLMGGVNLLAGVAFVAMHRSERRVAAPAGATPMSGVPGGFAGWAAAALLAGFAMMTVQTALNRIGALSLGASHFTFAMVVASFVLCIALGSFAVAALPRIPARALPLSQWALVACLIGLGAFAEDAPYWAHRVRLAHPESFHGFYAAIFGWVLLILALPLALSGAFLPLVFHQLRREAADLGHVAGRLYGWNTLGSLLGALLGGYLVLFWLDLAGAWGLAVLALVGSAFLVTVRCLPGARRPALMGALLAVLAVAGQPAWEPERLVAGLFRSRLPAEIFEGGPDAYFARAAAEAESSVLYYDDDPLASVAAIRLGSAGAPLGLSIVTNGKSDGMVPRDDRTMALAALLPAMLADGGERAFVIGYGTGVTAGELAALDDTREVAVAEISPGVMEAAPYFEELNRGALASPKLRVIRSDAYRALLRSQQRWDVIVSEPSNPWVTGVEMLFSTEFLEAARSRLAPGGVYAQWFHTYETDAETIELVFRTFAGVFGRVAVWQSMSTDLLILGFEDPEREIDLARLASRMRRPDYASQLAALGIDSLPGLLAHELLPMGVLGRMQLDGPRHTILHPILSDTAARAFYTRAQAELPTGLTRAAADTGARQSLLQRHAAQHPLDDEEWGAVTREGCRLDAGRCATLFARWAVDAPGSETFRRELALARASEDLGEALAPRVLGSLVRLFAPEAIELDEVSYELAADIERVFSRHYHHGAPFHTAALHSAWRRCAARDARCAEGLERVLSQGRSAEAAPTQLSRASF